MRTTITLDSDVEALVNKLMRQRAVSFKQAINETLREALSADRDGTAYSVPTFDMGEPKVDLTHALRLAAALEDDQSARDLEVGR